MTRKPSIQCPLCSSHDSNVYHQDRHRSYRRCKECDLVFVPPGERPDIISEKSGYDQEISREERTRELQRIIEPLLERLSAGSLGLDFGSGPDQLLASLLRDNGMRVRTYDVFYDPDASVWYQEYDFITCTGVIEHLHAPGREFARLFQALKAGGWLAAKTPYMTSATDFGDWEFGQRRSNVCFYSDATLNWIAAHHQATLSLQAPDIILLHKPAG